MLPLASVLQLVALALSTILAVGWARRRIATRRMPPFVPLSELSLPELILYPIFGHAMLFNQNERLDRITAKHGTDGKDRLILWVGRMINLGGTVRQFRDAAPSYS